MKSIYLSVVVTILAAGCAMSRETSVQESAGGWQTEPYYAPPSKSQRYDLTGVWEGQLRGFKGPGLFDEFVWNNRIRLSFRDEGTAVFLIEDDAWRELDAGLWRAAQHESNAVVYAIDVSDDRPDDGFVETWSFTITQLRSLRPGAELPQPLVSSLTLQMNCVRP